MKKKIIKTIINDKNNKIKVKKTKNNFFLKFFFMLVCLFLLGGTILYFYLYRNLPNIDNEIDFRSENVASGKIHFLFNDNLNIIKSYNVVDKDDITYNELSPNLINALIATEDRRFFEHHGVDLLGIARAFVVNIKKQSFVQGGSTITQQLAKSILKDNSKNLKRKLKELIITVKLEKIFSKEEIITMYLNINYFGAGKIGIKNASEFYFSKLPSDLSVEESALLIGLLKAPSKFAPTVNQEMATRRALQVIINMQNAGYLTPKDVLSYVIPNIQYSYNEINRKSQKYYFTDWLRKKIINLEKEKSIDKNIDQLNVITTMNSKIQNIVEETTYKFLDKNKAKMENSQIAIVVMNNNGEVLSMLGGRNYDQSAFNRSLYAYRHTGSLFKLFVYLNAFENGLKITDVFVDEPIAVKNWYPENYGKKYYGNVLVSTAFTKSLNSVAIQIAEYFGLNNLIDLAKKMGITAHFEKNDLTITLGTTNINLLEITKAYAIVNNNGFDVNISTIKNITTKDNETIYSEKNMLKKKLLGDYAIANMQQLLYETIKQGTGKQASVNSLIEKTEKYNEINDYKRYFIGGKTGSTQDSMDAWFVGYANDITVGIWMGNDDNSSTNNLMGGNLPAMLWKEIVTNLIN